MRVLCLSQRQYYPAKMSFFEDFSPGRGRNPPPRGTNITVNGPTPPIDGPPSPADERQLIDRARKRDAEAMHQLVDRYAHDLYVTAMYHTGSDTDARDAVQETFKAMIESLPDFRGDSSIKTWLWGILYRQAMRARRRRRRPDVARLTIRPHERSHAAATDAKLDLQAALKTLSEEHRQVIVLRELEQMSYADIAEVLGLPQGTIESRLHRARQALREALKAYSREEQTND